MGIYIRIVIRHRGNVLPPNESALYGPCMQKSHIATACRIIAREASAAVAEGKAASFKRRSGKCRLRPDPNALCCSRYGRRIVGELIAGLAKQHAACRPARLRRLHGRDGRVACTEFGIPADRSDRSGIPPTPGKAGTSHTCGFAPAGRSCHKSRRTHAGCEARAVGADGGGSSHRVDDRVGVLSDGDRREMDAHRSGGRACSLPHEGIVSSFFTSPAPADGLHE